MERYTGSIRGYGIFFPGAHTFRVRKKSGYENWGCELPANHFACTTPPPAPSMKTPNFKETLGFAQNTSFIVVTLFERHRPFWQHTTWNGNWKFGGKILENICREKMVKKRFCTRHLIQGCLSLHPPFRNKPLGI
ncbi:unnamed protein product [Laminaria digitata]